MKVRSLDDADEVNRWRGQTVAVIDTGIAYDHTSLGNGFGSGYRVIGGWDFAENDLGVNSPIKIKTDQIRKFLHRLVEDYFLNERSLARNISSLRSFFGFGALVNWA